MKKFVCIACLLSFCVCPQSIMGECKRPMKTHEIDTYILKNFKVKGSINKSFSDENPDATQYSGKSVNIYTTIIECVKDQPVHIIEDFDYNGKNYIYEYKKP